MGYARPKPKRLAEKLKQIRLALGLTQPEIWRRLGVEDIIAYNRISEYESGKREPLLAVLLQYSRVAGIHTEALIDDEIALPDKLPGPVNYDEIKRAYPAPSVKKRRKS